MRSLLAWIIGTFSAAVIGARFMPGDWYAALDKPAWNPPDWVFGPVWSALYLMMGIAAWLVWRKRGFAGARGALTLYVLQLALNALWSYVFFGLHRTGLATVEIAVLWIAILATIVAFRRHHTTAAALLVPYLAWVGYAAALTFALWRMNA